MDALTACFRTGSSFPRSKGMRLTLSSPAALGSGFCKSSAKVAKRSA